MVKRRIIFNDYDSVVDGRLTLTGWQLSDPVYKANFVSVPGRDGDLDLTTALTDGEPRYNNRTLTATFESSEGTRLERQEIFDDFKLRLDGRRAHIILPDYAGHYLDGRVQVSITYNDNAHGALAVTANCDPWLYSVNMTVLVLPASDIVCKYILRNYGRRPMIPILEVSGSVSLTYRGSAWELSDGVYTLPDFALLPGSNIIEYSGDGALTFKYREAIL